MSRKIIERAVIGLVVLTQVFILAPVVNAQCNSDLRTCIWDLGGSTFGFGLPTIATTGGTGAVSGLIIQIVLWLLSLVGVLGLLAVVIGGVMYIIAFGDENRTRRAKLVIVFAILGMLVSGGAYILVCAVGQLLLGASVCT